MKALKIFIPLLIIAMVFCSCTDEFDPDKYVSDGLLAAFGVIVDKNQYFYNDVFVLGHLEIDEKTVKKADGKTYAKVIDGTINTYDDLISHLKSIYTDDCVASILENFDFYRDFDGELYYDLSDLNNTRKGYKWVRNAGVEPELEGRTENSYTLEYKFDCGKKDELDEFTFTRVSDGYRLSKLQYVD